MNPNATPVFTRHDVYINPPYEEHVEHVELPVYDAEYERANFRYREEEYNQYISKLNTAYADLNVKYQDAIRVNQILKDENENLKRSSGEDVRNIYSLYTESKTRLAEYEFDNKTLAKELQARDEELIVKNTELNHLRNLVNDLKGQLGQMDINQTVDSQELTKIIGEQKNELGDMRRRLNLSLDHRRKLEQEVEALKFNNENTTSKFENELREKDMRMNQALRSVENEVHNRTKELTVQLTTYGKLEHDNIVLDRKNKELINDIALHINAEKLLHQEIEHKDRQNEAMRRELEIYKDPKRKATLLSFRPTANTHLIKLCNARFAREKQELFFKIWRLRYLLANEMKFRLTNEPLHGVDVADEDLKNKKRIVFDFDDTNDIGIATTLADGLLRTLKYVRQRASAIIFEIFVRSANNAEQKKSNSLILFSINVKEIDDRAWKTLSLLLDTYVIIRRLMKAFHPKFVKMKKPAGAGVLEKKLTYSLGKLTLQKGDIRDRSQVNRWIENSLVYIVNKRKYEQDLNKEFLFLYRVLAIKYRVLYPMRGKELDIEEDLRIYIDHKVLSSLHKVLKTHPKENQPLFDSKLIEDLDIRQMAGYGEDEEIEM